MFHLLTWQRHWIAGVIWITRIASTATTNRSAIENVAFSMSTTVCCIARVYAFIVHARFIRCTIVVHDTFVRDTGQCRCHHLHGHAFNKWISRIILWTATNGHVLFHVAHRIFAANFIGTRIFTKLPKACHLRRTIRIRLAFRSAIGR